MRTSPEDIVVAAVNCGLDAIAITDHNSVEGIEPIIKAAMINGLFVFPGIELSTRGGHTLAIFDEGTPIEKMRCLLDTLGFEGEQRGQGFAETSFWIDEVFQRIVEFGGLAVAAHVDRKPKGFIASDENPRDKMRIHSSDYLSALEVTIERDKALWNLGLMPHYPKRYACIQGSDAHGVGEVGRRFIYVDVPSLSLDGLRLAFREYGRRIFFPSSVEASTERE